MYKQQILPQLSNLLQFNQQDIFEQALTFKQYLQEHNSKYPNKITASNEMFIEFGSEILNFFFLELQMNNNSQELNSTFSQFQQSKVQTMTEANLAKLSIQMGLMNRIKISIKPNSPLKEQPKIQAQALKALAGAHYFDKNRNLNELRKILLPIYYELTGLFSPNGSTDDEDQQVQKLQNFKGEFLQFLQTNKEYYYKVVQEEIKDGNDITFTFEIILNDRFPVKKAGKNKRDVEREAYQNALKLVHQPIFQSIIKSKCSNDNSFFLETEVNTSNEKQEYYKFQDFDKDIDVSKQHWANLVDKILKEGF